MSRPLLARAVVTAIVGLAMQSGIAWYARAGSADQNSSLLHGARQAIGGEAKLGQLKSLVMQGTMRRGFNGVTAKLSDPRPVEYRVLLPDNFLCITGDEFIQQVEGFAGSVLLNEWKALKPGVQLNYSPNASELPGSQLRFARLVLGMLAETRTAVSLDVRVAPTAAGADTFSISAASGFAGYLDVDPASHVPLRVRYEQRVQFRRPLTPEEIKAGVMNPPDLKRETVEMALTFEDRRMVDGVSLPFRITSVARGVMFEEIQLQRILVNPPLTVKDFKAM